MSKKIVIGAILASALSLFVVSNVSAHVLITDETNTIGSVLHVMPDDDPIAGESSDLYFDVQASGIKQGDVTMSVLNIETGERTSVETKVENKLVTAAYTFPTQGVYELQFIVESDKTYTFIYAQRVSRGVEGAQVDVQSYFIADTTLVISGIIFLVLVILFINNRKQIKKHSSF